MDFSLQFYTVGPWIMLNLASEKLNVIHFSACLALTHNAQIFTIFPYFQRVPSVSSIMEKVQYERA